MNRRSLLALLLGLLLVAPGSLALVCATEAGCAMTDSPAAGIGQAPRAAQHPAEAEGANGHCAKAPPAAKAEHPPTAVARSTMACCCDERSEAAEPAVVLTTQPDPSRDVPGVVADAGVRTAALEPPLRACRSGPGDPTPPRAAGRDLLSLHQTFLN